MHFQFSRQSLRGDWKTAGEPKTNGVDVERKEAVSREEITQRCETVVKGGQENS